MQVRDLPGAAGAPRTSARPPGTACLGLGAALAALAVLPGAAADDGRVPTVAVGAAAQAARDDERLRILRDELQRTQALAAQLAQRSVERRAAGDPPGMQEAEAQRERALRDIAALEREIGATRHAAPRAAASSAHGPRPAQPAARWWDVYARAKGSDAVPAGSTPASAPVHGQAAAGHGGATVSRGAPGREE